MRERRNILKSVFGGVLLPLIGTFGAAAGPGRGEPRLLDGVAPSGRLFIVNGWILTEDDLKALDLR